MKTFKPIDVVNMNHMIPGKMQEDESGKYVSRQVAERLYEELKNMIEVSRYLSQVDRESALEAIKFADEN